MAPSRGFSLFIRTRKNLNRNHVRRYSDFIHAATNPANKAQIYISRCLDPYVNLSIEHYLLQKTPAESTILFLYTNRPSIIIGRNQNPWVEVNLGHVRTNDDLGVELVRRRSGGGTVFHDEGNVNYSVICPTSAFHRDTHAEMIVRALQKLDVKNARVNVRHDIVVDKVLDGEKTTHPFKVSGSAYKLTRLRSLHHGTCLLSSPNLQDMSKYLKSPAKPFINARGVESVSSRVANTELGNEEFENAVVAEFNLMYEGGQTVMVDEALTAVPDIAKGLEELKSDDWTYCQTPQFTFSTEHNIEQFGKSFSRTDWFPPNFKLDFTAKHGKFTELSLSHPHLSANSADEMASSLLNRNIHETGEWMGSFLRHMPIQAESVDSTDYLAAGSLNELLGTGGLSRADVEFMISNFS